MTTDKKPTPKTTKGKADPKKAPAKKPTKKAATKTTKTTAPDKPAKRQRDQSQVFGAAAVAKLTAKKGGDGDGFAKILEAVFNIPTTDAKGLLFLRLTEPAGYQKATRTYAAGMALMIRLESERLGVLRVNGHLTKVTLDRQGVHTYSLKATVQIPFDSAMMGTLWRWLFTTADKLTLTDQLSPSVGLPLFVDDAIKDGDMTPLTYLSDTYAAIVAELAHLEERVASEIAPDDMPNAISLNNLIQLVRKPSAVKTMTPKKVTAMITRVDYSKAKSPALCKWVVDQLEYLYGLRIAADEACKRHNVKTQDMADHGEALYREREADKLEADAVDAGVKKGLADLMTKPPAEAGDTPKTGPMIQIVKDAPDADPKVATESTGTEKGG